MKCPNCGTWNRASFPHCMKCGAVFPQENGEQRENTSPKLSGDGAGKVYIQINEEGRSSPQVDSRDQLAREMEDLLARKHRGEAEQIRLRQNSIEQGFVPSYRIAQSTTGRRTFPIPQSTSITQEGMEVEGEVRPDAIPVVSRRVIGFDEEASPDPGASVTEKYIEKRRGKRIKIYRHSFLSRYGKWIAAFLALIALLFAGYEKLYKPYMEKKAASSLQAQSIITPSILNEMPAHIIRLPGEEGQIYWITELKNAYPVVGGYATIEVADYKWYENTPYIADETVTATITPYLRTSAGEQKQMEQITFQVDVPESTLELVNPTSTYTQTYSQLYNIQIRVAKNSAVTINGEDYSDLVNSQDGLISYNALVSPIGDNIFVVTTRAQYCREKTVTLNIYREPQQIRLDLAADIATRYSPNRVEDKTKEPDEKGNYPLIEPNMTISGKTLTWAHIEIKSPYKNLDTTNLSKTGDFSFEAVFDRIGTNVIIIEASAPGYKTSVVEHEVYYVPIADVYTRKAWSMKDQYTDYLNNSVNRIASTQIYQCDGTITEILASHPQLAVLTLNDNSSRTVLLTNNTYDTWQVGSVYRIFGDAYGLYNGAPWLNGRYSYIQKAPE